MSKDGIVPGKHRSTSLKGGNSCPRWLDFYEEGTPYDRDIFQAGIVAHAILEEVSIAVNDGATPDDFEAIARNACKALMRDGRSHVGNPEPPIPEEPVEEGYDLAMGWLQRHEPAPGDKPEIGFAVSATPPDDAWPACAFDSPDFRFRGVIDLIRIYDEEGEEWGGRVLEVLDYKSSWVADSTELDTVQRKTQAILVIDWARRNRIEYDCLRLSIGNLRDRNIYSADYWLDDEETLETFARWRRFLSYLMDSLDKQAVDARGRRRPRPTNPGPACQFCPYKPHCDEGRNYALKTTGLEDVEQTARSWVFADSERSRLTKQFKGWLARDESVVYDGYELGWITTESVKPAPNAGIESFRLWLGEQPLTMDAVEGYLTIVKPTSTQIADLLYSRYSDDDERQVLSKRLLVPHTNKRFGIRKHKEKG